jgi:hypothetical protein
MLKEILAIIYADDNDKIIRLLNSSIYAAEYYPKVDSMIIQLGYSFSIQTGTTLELFYDFKSQKTIYQKRFSSSDLCLLGLICFKKEPSKFINNAIPSLIAAVSEDENLVQICESAWEKIKLKQLEYDLFGIVIKQVDGLLTVTNEYPLRKSLGRTIYFGNGSFRFNSPPRRSNYYSTSSDFYEATDGQLGELGDAGWTYLGLE